MPLFDDYRWIAHPGYQSVASAGTMTEEERDRKMTDYELAQQATKKLDHQFQMERERQTQDFHLAMAARFVVGAIVLGAVIALAPTIYEVARLFCGGK